MREMKKERTRGYRRECVAAVLAASLPLPALAQSIWTGGAGPSITAWNNPNNWLGGVVPASSSNTQIFFNGSVSSIQDLGNPFTLNALVFADSVTSTLSGSTINLSSASPEHPSIIQTTVGNDPLPSSVVRINNNLNLSSFLFLAGFPGYVIDFRGSITANGNPVYLLQGGIYSFNSTGNSIEQYQISSGSTALFHNAASLSVFATVAINNGAARPVGPTPLSLGKLVIGDFNGESPGTVTADIAPSTAPGSGTNTPFMLVGSVQGNAFNSILNGPMSLGSGTKTFTTLNPSHTLTVNSALSGIGSLQALNTTLKVSGSHTYTGTTTLTNATLQTLSNNILSVASAFTVDSTSTLNLTGTTQTLSTLNLQGTLNLTNASMSLGTNAASGASATLAGNLIVNNSTLIKSGPGTLTFSPSTLTGSGPFALEARAGNLITSLPAQVTDLRITSTLTASIPALTATTATLSGFGTFLKTGGGALTLTGASPNFRGTFHISQGAVKITNSLAAGLIQITANASLTVSPGVSLPGITSNSGTLINNGTLSGLLFLQPNSITSGKGDFRDIVFAANSSLTVSEQLTVAEDLRIDAPATIAFTFHSDFTSGSLSIQSILFNAPAPTTPPAPDPTLTLQLLAGPDFELLYPFNRPLIVATKGTFSPEVVSALRLDTSAFIQDASLFTLLVSPDWSTVSVEFLRPPIPEPALLPAALLLPLTLIHRRGR